MVNIISGLQKAISDLTGATAARRAADTEARLQNISLDALQDQIAFAQALGGVRTSQPFREISQARGLIEERRRRVPRDQLASSLFGAGASIFSKILGV